ncbi:class II aldolase/adducin domain protein [Histoplasma capsulatum var. duboisii H88]|uniref:Class II aldolase/adducin domain protein n=1 Tax=Ajellomyces capsulatus (strain H88) TaxID=544711 RepID=A0A8A1LRV3_AJEC8|nr:class II aldolase/adducin domain protein [Histoplasma capsulatum var. duboisii H88]
MLHSMVPEATFCMDGLLYVQSYGKDFDILTLNEIFGRGGLDIDDICSKSAMIQENPQLLSRAVICPGHHVELLSW